MIHSILRMLVKANNKPKRPKKHQFYRDREERDFFLDRNSDNKLEMTTLRKMGIGDVVSIDHDLHLYIIDYQYYSNGVYKYLLSTELAD